MSRFSTSHTVFLAIVAGALTAIPGRSVAEGNNRPEATGPLVEMAYGAELSGQPAVRDALVKEVLDLDSENENARWLAGHVQGENGWTTASVVEQSRSENNLLQEYVQRREACADDALSRLRLANWCRDHDMPDRERLHLTELVNSHGPSPAVMSRLGMIKFRGQWIVEEALDEFRRHDDRQRRIEKKWKPLFAKWKGDLKAGDDAAYARLAERLAEVNDGDALPILEEVLSTHNEKAALAVIERLDVLPMQEATESLVRHALFSEYDAVRSAAVEALKKRPKYNYMPMLIGGLVAPLEVTIELPHGGTNYVRRTVVQRGPDYDQRFVDHRALYAVRLHYGLGVSAAVLAPNLPSELKPGHYVEEGTEKTRLNERIQEILYSLTGKTHEQSADWWDWWSDHNEYEREEDKPTYARHRYQQSWKYRVSITPTPIRCYTRPSPPPSDAVPGRSVYYGVNSGVHFPDTGGKYPSCLASGTPVATETGSRPVEQILPGDKVLAQDPDTGQLDYKVVLQRTVRQLGEMRKVSVGDDSVTVTLGHPFWVVGRGWQMAKELENGQRVRGLGNSYEITAIEELPEDVAYNLVVDDFATYFAGNARLLLHDNTLPAPTDAVLPGYVRDLSGH